MPFLYNDGGMKMLFVKNEGVITPEVNLSGKFCFFREPWLSDPSYDAARDQIRDEIHAAPVVKYQPQRIDDFPNGTPVPLQISSADTVCSPIWIQGGLQWVDTNDSIRSAMNTQGPMWLPSWATICYGFSAPGIEVWVSKDSLTLGWQRGDDAPVSRVQFQGLADKSHIYRVVPTDQPDTALISVLAQPDIVRTFLVSMIDAPTVTELLVDGQPVYKSSICGTYCAFSVRDSLDRSVVVSDSFTLAALSGGVTFVHTLETPLPSGFAMISGFGANMAAWMRAGFPVTPQEQFDRRLALCRSCPLWEPWSRFFLGRCRKCGCTSIKQWLKTAVCPDGRW